MIQIRKSNERGHADHGWLEAYHSFSFADYYDPKFMGYRSLRVLNEDRIKGGTGFPSHPHKNMEIITYVVEGALSHKDSMGNTSNILPGEVQVMSAGTGVVHSEFNHSQKEKTHLIQIWIVPKAPGGTPGYQQKSFVEKVEKEKVALVVSGDGREGTLAIKQDALVYVGKLKENESFKLSLDADCGSWLQVIKGAVRINDILVSSGDGASIENEKEILLQSSGESEFLLFIL